MPLDGLSFKDCRSFLQNLASPHLKLVCIKTSPIMAVNRQGVFCRTVDNEEEDREQMFLNIRDQKWQEWPNEAGVSV